MVRPWGREALPSSICWYWAMVWSKAVSWSRYSVRYRWGIWLVWTAWFRMRSKDFSKSVGRFSRQDSGSRTEENRSSSRSFKGLSVCWVWARLPITRFSTSFWGRKSPRMPGLEGFICKRAFPHPAWEVREKNIGYILLFPKLLLLLSALFWKSLAQPKRSGEKGGEK